MTERAGKKPVYLGQTWLYLLRLFEECTEFLGRAIFWRTDTLTCSGGICFLHITFMGCDDKFRLSVPLDKFNLTLNMIHC